MRDNKRILTGKKNVLLINKNTLVMKKKKLIFILALFAVIWNSCFDDLPYSRRQERNQKTTDDAISLNAVKKYYSHIPLLTLPQTQDKANGGHGMNDSIDTAKDSTHVHTDRSEERRVVKECM